MFRVLAYNKEKGTKVRCYVPTHSLLNYADWGIVSPQQSLALLNGCDGYIAQVWTGTAREQNVYKNVKKERTFEIAYLEYGSMQNLVRSTGRSVWYLADPIEDNTTGATTVATTTPPWWLPYCSQTFPAMR